MPLHHHAECGQFANGHPDIACGVAHGHKGRGGLAHETFETLRPEQNADQAEGFILDLGEKRRRLLALRLHVLGDDAGTVTGFYQ